MLKNNNKVVCGTKKQMKNGENINRFCRPSKRVNSETPITYDEVIQKHGENKVLNFLENAIKTKRKKYINWEDLK